MTRVPFSIAEALQPRGGWIVSNRKLTPRGRQKTAVSGKHTVTYEYTAPPEPIKPFHDILVSQKKGQNQCD